jgi:hypothetical protein
MPKRIVFTRHDGEVAVCAPSLTAMAYMTGGGGRWDGFPRGFLDRQIAKQSEECGERHAHRFVMAMQFGGCTDAEAYELMRDRFCAHLGRALNSGTLTMFPRIAGFVMPGFARTTVDRSMCLCPKPEAFSSDGSEAPSSSRTSAGLMRSIILTAR